MSSPRKDGIDDDRRGVALKSSPPVAVPCCPWSWSLDFTMQSINRFLYGPTPEEKIRALQGNIRGEQRRLDRDMREVRYTRDSRAFCDVLILFIPGSS